MIDPVKIFKEYCAANKMRYTPEREIIIQEIYRKDEHFDTDNLFLRIRQRYPKLKIARASIYRTLPHLIKAGLLRESFHQEGKTTYEHILGHTHHDHMRCIQCGKTFEFYNKEIDEIQKRICKKDKFKMVWHVHVLFGYCSRCESKPKRRIKNP